ncbi:MAG: Pr6Pr family membrane protein [Treponema sp.]|jgi:hypothetical protein|nr:Pr6Pr family membrane protein [Treponema sp.]
MVNALIVVCAFVGIGIFLVQLDTAMILSAFTTQSNLLCVAAAVLTLARGHDGGKTGGGYTLFKGMALTSILLTFVITALVLKPFFGGTATGTRVSALADNLLHVVVPLLMFADFVLFEEKGNIKAWHPASWAAFPLYYVGYTAVYRALGGVYRFGNDTAAKFPYFFFDYETYGAARVATWFLLIAIGFIGFSYALFGFDRALAACKKRKA